MLFALTMLGLAAEMALGHLARPGVQAPPPVEAVQAAAVAVAGGTLALGLWSAAGTGPTAARRMGAAGAVMLALMAIGAGAHLEAALRAVALPPPWAPVLGALFALVALASLSEDRARTLSFGALAALALAIALASASDHGRRGVTPLPWTLLGPGAGLIRAAAATAAAARPHSGGRRRAVGWTGGAAVGVAALGLALHAHAPSHALALPLLQRLALPPPLLAPAALALAGLWAIHFATGGGPRRVVWLVPGRGR